MDGEHRAFDARERQALAAFHHLADIDCIWRPPTLGKTGPYRLLEDGLRGLMIPPRKHGKAWGRPVDGPDEVKRLEQMGAQFLVVGNEFVAVYSCLRAWGAEFDAALGEVSAGKDVAIS